MSDPIKFLLVDLLDNNWNTSNAEKPGFDTTRFDQEKDEFSDLPLITISMTDENARGTTGYSAIRSTGDPVQRFDGEAQTDIWTTRRAIQNITSTRTAEGWIHDAKEECQRIIAANHAALLPEYEYIAWLDGNDQHEREEEPVIYHRVNFIGYHYEK